MKLSTKELIVCALFASITALLSQIAIPFTPIPLTMQLLAVMLCGLILGAKLGFISQVIYVLLGTIGVPVFAGMSGGPGIILGQTGGFILSFPIVALIVGYFSKKQNPKIKVILGMVLGLLSSYLIGTMQFCFLTKSSFIVGLMACVVPFVFMDVIKIALAYSVGSIILKRVKVGLGVC